MIKHQPLCTAARCAAQGRHLTDCTDEHCRGCLPWQAADGRYLCEIHARRIGEDALTIALRYADLGRVLTSTGSALGDIVSGSKKETGMQLNDRAAEMRMIIKHRLVALARMISEDRGFALPEDRVPALARYVAANAPWLAAHPAAGDFSEELADAASDGFRIAYPTGARRYQLRDPENHPVGCKETVEDDQPCPGTLWTVLRRTDSLLPSELVCDHDQEHYVPAEKWMSFGKQWLKGQRIATEPEVTQAA